MDFDIGIAAVAWCTLALFLGGVIKGVFGIGTPLLTVPMMSLALPAQLTVILMAGPVLLANGWQALQTGNALAVARRFWPLLVAMLIGMSFGTRMLATMDARPLIATIGSLIISIAGIQFFRPLYRCPANLERPLGMGAGLAAGVVGGISSMFGPPLILFLLTLTLRKNEFVQATSMLFLWAVIPWVATLVLLGMLNRETTLLSLLAAAPTLCGVFAGQRLRPHVDDARFRGTILALVALSGAVMLGRAAVA